MMIPFKLIMKHAVSVSLACLLLISACRASAQENKFDFAALEKGALAELKAKGIPGAAVGVVLGDKLVFARGLGVANTETGEPVKPEMLFRLGSTTKMFTSAALLALVNDGKIRLDAPIGNYLDGIVPRLEQVTSRQLLSHTAGLRDEAPMFGPHDETALADMVKSFKADYFFTDQGVIYSYSNPGYWVAGLVIERTGRKPYADVLSEYLFQPLGMTRTTFRPTMAMTWPLATGHGPGGKIIRPAADNAATRPAGQMFSSVPELARFVIALLNDGRLEGRQVLPLSTVQAMTTAQAEIPGGEAKYGFGLRLTREKETRVWSHSGSRAGYGSLIQMLPDQHVGIITLCNLTGAALSKTAAEALGPYFPLRPPREPAAADLPPMSTAEMAKCVGVFSDSKEWEEIMAHKGRLWWRTREKQWPVTRITQDHFLARPEEGSGQESIVLVFDDKNYAEYLFRGGHALRRMPAKK